jgi:hypothetical protein
VAITKLRRFTSLPIEVFHDAAVMRVDTINEFEALPGVHVIELKHFDTQSTSSRIASSILASSFMNVLVIDARTMVLSDPSLLFDAPEYEATGMIMLSSLYKTSSMNPIWNLLNRKCIDSFEQSADAVGY